MISYNWPKHGEASVIGKEHDRIDGLEKATGAAKYTYDINLEGMLFAKMLGCPHAHCRIKSIDTSAAEKMPGVRAVKTLKEPDNEIRWQGDALAVVAADTEAAAAAALEKIKVEYEMLDVFVDDEDLEAAEKVHRTNGAGEDIHVEMEPDPDVDEDEFNVMELERQFKEAAAVVEGYYGISVITHMCLEPHGSTCVWDGDKLIAYLSTQNVSGTAAQFATPLSITAGDVTVKCDFIGGGFGSKFAADAWGVTCAQLAKETGRPVKLMLDRDQELKVAGCRPSGFIKVRIGADKEGLVTCWDSTHWGTGGPKDNGGVNKGTIPYVMVPKNYRRKQIAVMTNTGEDRAWRAPNHPQACAMSQTALDDIAAKLGLDSYEVFLKNLDNATPKKAGKSMAETYREEMKIAARLMDWKAKWHPHGKGQAKGDIVTGVGMALHTWGGGAANSNCLVKVHPDGAVEAFLGSQDLGTGTRTVITSVIAETFGLPLSAVKVNIGSSAYPASAPSGGSITVGSVSESSRRASQEALETIFEKVGKKLGVEVSSLEARDGRIRVRDDKDNSLSWQEACRLLGMNPLEVTGKYQAGQTKTTLSSSQVGGVQMAEVAVDRRTGVVKMKKFVAVQDMGLVINPKTAKSQMYGAAIMGIAYSLFEERIMDAKTGAFVNAELADYKLPRLGDIGEIVVEIYQPESEYQRGVVGLGEPPVISPGAAISNAVCNALGVRVPVLPLTPKRVLDALKGGKA